MVPTKPDSRNSNNLTSLALNATLARTYIPFNLDIRTSFLSDKNNDNFDHDSNRYRRTAIVREDPNFMHAQQSQTKSSSLPIRRARSTPRLIKNTHPFRSSDTSALVTSPLATPDSSSGDESSSWIKPKGRTQFDCNICFDAARDPVVTQCGHLYCWACLHQVISI